MISIAMATYNGEQFLKQQLDSLSEQVQPPSELVVCDDASTDRTVEIIKRFSETASFPVRLFVNEHQLGWRANFLKAASLCTSEYIAFCDQDDVWFKNKISVVTRYIQETQCTLLQHCYQLIDNNGNVTSGIMNYDFVKRHTPWKHSGGLTQVFHSSLNAYLDLWDLSVDHGVENEKMGHDQWIFFLSSVVGRTIFIDDVLLFYRQHDRNIIGFGTPVRVNRPIDFRGTLLANASRYFGDGVAFKVKHDEVIWIIRHFASAASARAKIIEALILRSNGSHGDRLRSQLQYYRGKEAYWSERLSAYFSATRRQRLQALLSVRRRGLYKAQGRQGFRDAVVDILYGVMC